jgi:hypothetical protein
MAAIIVAEFAATGSVFTGRFQTFDAGKMSQAARPGGGCGVGVGTGFGVGFGDGFGVGAGVGRGVVAGVGYGVAPGVGVADAAALALGLGAALAALTVGSADDASGVAAAAEVTVAPGSKATPCVVPPGLLEGFGIPVVFSRIATVITPASAKKTIATRVPRSDMPAG